MKCLMKGSDSAALCKHIPPVVRGQNHQSIFPETRFFELARDIGQLIVQKIDHGGIRSAVVLLNEAEFVLVGLGGLERVVDQLGVIVEKKRDGRVMVTDDVDHAIAKDVLLMLSAVQLVGWLVSVPKVHDQIGAPGRVGGHDMLFIL